MSFLKGSIMNRRAAREILLALTAGLLLAESASAAPLVYIQLLARPDGTDQPFSNTVQATSVGEEFDWIVVATLAPAGTENTNLPVDANGKQQIGSWQASTSTPATNDGLGGMILSLFQNPANSTQISFQSTGYLGSGGKSSIDQNIFDGLTTKSGASNNTAINGNASFTGGANTFSYSYTASGNIQRPAVTLKPTGVGESSSGYALFQNYGQGIGASGGRVTPRSARNENGDITNILAIGPLGSGYFGVDPAVANASATNQSPISVIIESGSNAGGVTYNNGGGDANGNDSAFKVTNLHRGISTLNINAFDMNPGYPGGGFTPDQSFLILQYHDTAGNAVRPGNETFPERCARILCGSRFGPGRSIHGADDRRVWSRC